MTNATSHTLPSTVSGHVACHYKNTTSRLQILRIENVPNWYFERVIFPGQSLIFHTAPEALLEVHSYEMATAIVADRIPCSQLLCKDSASTLPAHYRQRKTGLEAA
ncbi:MAG: DUF1830 domain-containing protein [Leptolyngbyaceae cyanobacterium]